MAPKHVNLSILSREAALAADSFCVDCDDGPGTHEVEGHDPRCETHHAVEFEQCDCGAWHRHDARYRIVLGDRDQPGYREQIGCPVCVPDEPDEPDWDAIRDRLLDI